MSPAVHLCDIDPREHPSGGRGDSPDIYWQLTQYSSPVSLINLQFLEPILVSNASAHPGSCSSSLPTYPAAYSLTSFEFHLVWEASAVSPPLTNNQHSFFKIWASTARQK